MLVLKKIIVMFHVNLFFIYFFNVDALETHAWRSNLAFFGTACKHNVLSFPFIMYPNSHYES
jgi:hypothetical protein